MNLGKCLIGSLFLGVMLLFSNVGAMSKEALLFLGASGLLGIALGDTLFFKSLAYLGPRLLLALGTLGPVVTVILAVIFLKERPPFIVWIGMALTIGGVSWVLWERSSVKNAEKKRAEGIKYGLLSILCASTAIILAKAGVASVSALQATFIRLLFGAIGLLLWAGASRQISNWLSPFKNMNLLGAILMTVFIAVFGGFWLFLAAIKYTDVSTATILNSTTPLFILPMTALILKEKISLRAIAGAGVAVAGVILIFLH